MVLIKIYVNLITNKKSFPKQDIKRKLIQMKLRVH